MLKKTTINNKFKTMEQICLLYPVKENIIDINELRVIDLFS